MRSPDTWCMSEDKRLLRQKLRREACTGDTAALCRRLLAHPWFLRAKTVMGYMAIPPEPDLGPVLEACLSMGKGLLLPRCEADGTMTARIVTALADLETGSFGILEPPETLTAVAPEDLELILVPGMAFSPKGARLGRGKGFYDRFLEYFRGKTVGICYENRVLEEIPVEEHDRFVDAVLTDKRAILCEMEGEICSEKGRIPGMRE